MAKIINLVGQKFGRLTVIQKENKLEYLKRTGAYWLCECECNKNRKIYYGIDLRNEESKSCGCYKIDKSLEGSVFPETLTDEEIQIIEGHLLGDASIVKANERTAAFSLRRQIRDKEYLEWTAHKLNRLRPDEFISELSITDDRYGTTNDYANYKSSCKQILASIREKWYPKPDEIKIVPRDLKLSSLMVAIWLCDDGCCAINKAAGNTSMKIEFATQGFTENDVEFLAQLLRERYHTNDIFKQAAKLNVNGIMKWGIIARTSACVKIIRDIEKYIPILKMERKITWTEEALKKYEDPNYIIRITSQKDYKEMKRKETIKFLKVKAQLSEIFTAWELMDFMAKTNYLGKPIHMPGNKITLKIFRPLINLGYLKDVGASSKRHRLYQLTDLGKNYYNSL